MYIGDTYQEKAASMDLLCKKAKRIGRIFMIIGIFTMLILFSAVLNSEGSIFAKIFSIIPGLLCPVAFYWVGYFWYFGFVTVKSWFVKRDVSAGEVAAAAGNTLAISYLIGGKKAAKTSFIIMFLIFALVASIGFYAGIYQYFSIKRQLAKGC